MREKLEQYGALNSLKRLLSYVLRNIGIEYSMWLLCQQEINLSRLDDIQLDSNYFCKRMSYADFVNSGRFGEKKLKSFKKRFERDSFYAYGIFSGSELAYYCWISLSQFQFSNDRYFLDMSCSEGLLFDAFCFKEHRRNGLHNYMNIYRLRQLVNFGKTTALVVLLNENRPARRAQSVAGFRCSRQVITYNIFGYRGHILRNKIIDL